MCWFIERYCKKKRADKAQYDKNPEIVDELTPDKIMAMETFWLQCASVVMLTDGHHSVLQGSWMW